MINKKLPGSTVHYRLLRLVTCLKTTPMQMAGFYENKSPVTPLTPAKIINPKHPKRLI